MTDEERKEHKLHGQLALRALRRAVRNAFLDGTAYDPDGKGKIYWETHDEFDQPIEIKQPA